jgi:hypothetical protein
MIPWLVNGRVGEDERRALDGHLRNCAECRAEFDEQQRVRSAMCEDRSRVDYAAGASLQKLWARIGHEEPHESTPSSVTPIARKVGSVTRNRVVQWLVAAVAVEAVGMTMLAAASLNKSPVNAATALPAFKTVMTTEIVPTTTALRVVFAQNLTVNEMNTLLHDENLEIVNGPSVTGAYTLATVVSPNELDARLPEVLASLRTHAGVRLVEPIVHGSESKP